MRQNIWPLIRMCPFFAAFYYIAKAHLQYFFGDYEAALTTALKAEEVVEGVRGMIWEPILGFLYPLILVARYPEAPLKTKQKYWKKTVKSKAANANLDGKL